MSDRRVHVFDDAVVVAGNVDGDLDERPGAAPVEAEQTDGPSTRLGRGDQSRNHVRRVARRANRQHHISRLDQVADLLGKDALVG